MRRQWIRLYTSVLSDPKILVLPDSLFRFWVNCLLTCGLSGDYLPVPCRLKISMRISERQVTDNLTRLKEFGLVEETPDGWKLHDWEQYQYDSDFSRDRMKRHRDGQRTVTVTRQNRTEQNRIEQTVTSSNRGTSKTTPVVEGAPPGEQAAPAALVPAKSTLGELGALLAVFEEFGRGCAERDLKTCERIWAKLGDPDRQAAAAGVAASMTDWRARPTEKIPQPWNYLQGRYWERTIPRRQPPRSAGKFESNFREAAAKFIRETSAGGKP